MTTKKFVVEVTVKKYHPKNDLKYIMSRLEDAVKNSSFQWRDSFMVREIKNDK